MGLTFEQYLLTSSHHWLWLSSIQLKNVILDSKWNTSWTSVIMIDVIVRFVKNNNYLILSLLWTYMHLNACECDNTAYNQALLLSWEFLKRHTLLCATNVKHCLVSISLNRTVSPQSQCQNDVSISEVTLYL